MIRRAFRSSVVVARRQWFHSSSSCLQQAKTQVRDSRLAGRLRFYKQVGVAPAAAPWEESSNTASSTTTTTVESPISAGVDGTQSASGTSLSLPNQDVLKSLLIPKQPNSNNKQHQSSSSRKATKWFGITLDGRSIKTPLGHALSVPSENLAWAIASEWDAQTKALQPAQMPIMTLVCTALDQTASNGDVYRQNVLKYLNTDTTCYFADPNEDRVLYRNQQSCWNELHEWVALPHVLNSKPACALGASEAMLMSRARSKSSSSNSAGGLPHPPSLVHAAKTWLDSLDAWHLTAMYSIAAEAKSFLVGMALILESSSCGHEDNPFFEEVHKAVLAARVEEEFQIDNWGLVEGGHDYDRLNCSIQLHSAHFLTAAIAADNF